MYICANCNKHFTSEEADSRQECVGEFWGTPAYQSFTCCPYCGSDDVEEGVECEMCGTLHFEGELIYGLCEKCSKEIDSEED